MQLQPLVTPILLASGSPRRIELLGFMGIPFNTISPNVDEHCEGTPAQRVCTLSLRKAEAVKMLSDQQIILAADTLVSRGNLVLGKPLDREEAVAMLRLLSGQWHEVYTGVCILDGKSGIQEIAFDRTEVRFSPMDERMIQAYVETGEPMDKAGAYAIQGRGGMFVEEIRGSYSNVIGLPMALVRKMLAKFDIVVL